MRNQVINETFTSLVREGLSRAEAQAIADALELCVASSHSSTEPHSVSFVYGMCMMLVAGQRLDRATANAIRDKALRLTGGQSGSITA